MSRQYLRSGLALAAVIAVASAIFPARPSEASPNTVFRGTIAFGQSVTGIIVPNGFDTWRFTGQQGWRIVVEMSGFDTYLHLRHGNQEVAADDDGLSDRGGGSRIIYDLPEFGDYTIMAAGYRSASGGYALSLGCGSFGCAGGAFIGPCGDQFASEICSALDQLDRAGQPWVRDTVDRWVSTLRFDPSDRNGYLLGTGFFGITSFPDGQSTHARIQLAESQRSRGAFLAAWLSHEALHVWQANNDPETYQFNCRVRESQAYMAQGYILLELFGQNISAIRQAGAYPDELRYAQDAADENINDLTSYVQRIYSDCR